MKKIFLLIISLCLFSISQKVLAATQDIIINEIGASESSGYEWIEIYNRGQNPIDLTGWKFVEDFSDSKPNGTSHSLNFNGNTTLAPNQYAIIAQDQNKFKEKYPNFSGLLIDSSWSSLNESGEKIGLKDTDSNFSEIFTYLESKNYSLERKNPSLNDYTSTNWQEHPSGNTIGEKNYFSSPQPDSNSSETINNASNAQIQTPQEQITSSGTSSQPLLIANAGSNIIALVNQEIELDASLSQGAQDYEWNFGDGSTSKEKIAKHSYSFPGKYIVTLSVSNGTTSTQNQISTTIHPSGVYINELLPSPQGSDTENEWVEIFNSNNYPVNLSEWILASGSRKFSIPKNTFISPQSYLVLSRKITKISLGNSNGSLKFYYPENILINEINYEKAKEGFSASRKQDGNFTWTKSITPSGPNTFSSANSSAQSLNNIPPQSVTQNNTKINSLIAENKINISSENFIYKNIINTALAQTVQEDNNEIVSQQEVNTNAQAPKINDHTTETQANITHTTNTSNIIIGSFIILAITGFSALMWRVIRKK